MGDQRATQVQPTQPHQIDGAVIQVAKPVESLKALASDPATTLAINTVLAAATLAVTCVAIAVGLSAVFGYQAAKRIVKRQAIKQAQAQTTEHLKSDVFREQLAEATKRLLADHIRDTLVKGFGETKSGTGQTGGREEITEEGN